MVQANRIYKTKVAAKNHIYYHYHLHMSYTQYKSKSLLRNFKKEIIKRNNFDPLIKSNKDIPYLVDQHLLEKDNAQNKS